MMRDVKRSLVHSWKLFCCTPILWGVCLAGYVALLIFMATRVGLARYSIATYLNGIESAGTLLFLLIAVIAYEFLYQEKACALDECLSVNKPACLEFQLCRLVLLIPVILINSVTVLAYLLTTASGNGVLTIPVMEQLLLSWLLNILLIQLIGLLLGGVLASFSSRPVSYILLALWCLLMSDRVNYMISLFPINIGGEQTDFTFLTDIFRIAAPDTSYVPDSIYGLSIERYRWALALFWTAALLGLFLWRNRVQRRGKRLAIPLVLFAVAAVGLAGFLQVYGDSIVRLDERSQGTLFGDYTYASTHQEKEEEAGFSVLSYDLELDIKARLCAQATMEITQNPQSDQYLFTLYRGYRIRSVTDGEGTALDYDREGNYLDITYPLTEKTGYICVTYQGSGRRYYSNNQGIALVGYFPWYPRAGHLSLWDSQQGGSTLNVSDTQSDFVVSVHTNLPLVSNLEQVDENTFAGTALGATLVGGLLEEKETTGGLHYYASPLNLTEPNLDEARTNMTCMEDLLGVSFGIDWENVKILPMPDTISKSSTTEAAAVLGNHLLVNTDGYELTSALLKALIPYHKDRAELRQLLTQYYMCLELSRESEISDIESQYGVEDWSGLPEAEKILEREYDDGTFEEAETVEQLLRYQMKEYGVAIVLRDCYDYLSSDSTQSELEFLYAYSPEEGGAEQ